jgi:AcrR family transcriptional regulator
MSTPPSRTPAQQSLRERKREVYRESVLDAAERVFGEQGYDTTKVQEIAAEAGVSLTTLYSVLPSKWEIYRAVNQRRLDEVMAQVRELLGQERPFLDMLVAGVRMKLAFFMQRRDFTKMQLKEVTAWSTVELPKSREQVEALGAGLALFSDVFRRGIAEGYLVEDDPEVMSRIAIAALQVRMASWMERGCVEQPDRVAAASLRHLLRSWCRPEQLSNALAAADLEERP